MSEFVTTKEVAEHLKKDLETAGYEVTYEHYVSGKFVLEAVCSLLQDTFCYLPRRPAKMRTEIRIERNSLVCELSVTCLDDLDRVPVRATYSASTDGEYIDLCQKTSAVILECLSGSDVLP